VLYTARQPKGHVIITYPEGQVVERDTLQCVHCQAHWMIEPGSGKQRGWCWRCDGPTCGAPACMSRCEPWEKALEIAEARAKLFRDIERL
jgi:hypothetical protein